MLCIVFVMNSYAALSQSADTIQKNENIFGQIKRIPQKDRITVATGLYKSKFSLRKASAVVAMTSLDRLDSIARSLHDKPLECAVFELRADYYSVNRGFNPLSITYYQRAIDFSKANNLLFETGLYLHKMGLYYNTFKHNALACRYFLQSQDIFNQVGYDKIPGISVYLSQVGDFYYRLGDYEIARKNLETALRYISEYKRDRINIINTIALTYRSHRQFPEALNYFNQALLLATATRDTVWIGIVDGNIGSVYFLKNQYQTALPYIETDYNTSIKYGEIQNGLIALLRLIKINIDTKNFDRADQQLKTAESYLRASKTDVLDIWADFYDLKSQLYEKQGLATESIIYRKKYEQDKDSLTKRDNLASVERVKLQYEIDKHNAQVNQLEADSRVQSVEIKAAAAILCMLFVISFLAYYNQRQKNKKDKALLMAEKRVVDEELKSAAAALNNFTENLRQKNILIENFKTEIERLRAQFANIADVSNLEALLEVHLMTDESWNTFKKLFSKVYPGFFINLSNKFPQLSTADTRILALTKLGLNNAEMANMLGVTVDAVQKAKQRMRKKVGIDAVSDLGSDISAN